jgi:hypothetical protein
MVADDHKRSVFNLVEAVLRTRVSDLDKEITSMLLSDKFSMSSADLAASLLYLARKGDTSRSHWLHQI